MKNELKPYFIGAVCSFLIIPVAHAVPTIGFEWTEGGPGNGTNSAFSSFHNATGPVLADDFTPSVSGRVVQIDWWGSAGIAGAPNSWEVTFHSDNPIGTPSFPFLSQHFLNATGVDLDGDGVFSFSGSWNPQDLVINAGQDYWFSVANASTNNWLWANPGAGPTVGSEQYDALQSVGGLPSIVAGPHDGPWLATSTGQDFAFRIWVGVPVPATLALVGLGLAGIGFQHRRNKKA